MLVLIQRATFEMVDNVMRTYFILEPTCFTLLMLLKWNFVSPQGLIMEHNLPYAM